MIKRALWLTCGLISLIIGIVGVFLPLLPTTPFVLLSAVCFSRSSKRLHHWLLTHKVFGGLISDWEKHGVIRTKTKIIATASMVILISYPLFFMGFAVWIKLMVIFFMSLVMAFIWSRPGQAKC